jgi:hypothetical protein
MSSTAIAELNMEGLQSARIGDPRPVRTFGIITRADRPLSAVAETYVDLLFDAIAAKTRTRLRSARPLGLHGRS